MVLSLIVCFLVVLAIALLRDIISLEINKRRTGISFKESIDLTELPVITLHNGGQKLNFLLDTGSNISHLNSKAEELLKRYDEVHKAGFDIATATGVTEGSNKWVSVPLQYKKQSFIEDFMLLDLQEAFDSIKKENGVQLHGILGNSFFTKYKYVLDFEDLVAYTK